MARCEAPGWPPSPAIAHRSCVQRRPEACVDGGDDLSGKRRSGRVREMRSDEKMREGEKTGAGDVVRWPELEILPAATAGRRGRVRQRGGALPRGCGGENGGGRGGFKGACRAQQTPPKSAGLRSNPCRVLAPGGWGSCDISDCVTGGVH